MLSGNYLVEIYHFDDKKIVNIKLMENTCWDWQQIWSGFSRAYWLPNWYWAFDRVTPYKSCVYMLSTQNKWWAGVSIQSSHSGSSLHLTSKQYGLGWRPQEFFFSLLHDWNILSFLALWIKLFFVLTKETYRSEFPGLKASPNWVLTDAAGGTQVHNEPLARLFRLTKVLLPPLQLHLLTPQLTWEAPIHQPLRQ